MKHFIWAFLLALGLYALLYTVIESRRVHRAPWEVAYTNTGLESLTLVIRQRDLGITNATLVLPGVSMTASDGGGVVRFDTPHPVPYPLPFGRCLFMDITFLPGSVTLDVSGHQVEMLPSRLMLDGKAVEWRDAGRIEMLPGPAPQP